MANEDPSQELPLHPMLGARVDLEVLGFRRGSCVASVYMPAPWMPDELHLQESEFDVPLTLPDNITFVSHGGDFVLGSGCPVSMGESLPNQPLRIYVLVRPRQKPPAQEQEILLRLSEASPPCEFKELGIYCFREKRWHVSIDLKQLGQANIAELKTDDQ